MGIILMHPLTSGVFQRLMAELFPQFDTDSRVGVGRGPPAAQLCALGTVCGRGAGLRPRPARHRDTRFVARCPCRAPTRSGTASRHGSTGTGRASALHDRYVR
jgi:hypothetical protein